MCLVKCFHYFELNYIYFDCLCHIVIIFAFYVLKCFLLFFRTLNNAYDGVCMCKTCLL